MSDNMHTSITPFTTPHEQPCRWLMIFSIGPVQEFIAQARRTRDLWFGSYLLSELAQAGAVAFQNKDVTTGLASGELVYPVLYDPQAEQQEQSRSETDDDELNAPNKIIGLIHTDQPHDVARRVRFAITARWMELSEQVLNISGLKPMIDIGAWNRQVRDLVEFYAVWSKVNDEADAYFHAQRRAEAMMTARKTLRDFKPNEPRLLFGESKSSLDGGRESVWRLNAKPHADEERLLRQWGITVREPSSDATRHAHSHTSVEQLDAISLVKRLFLHTQRTNAQQPHSTSTASTTNQGWTNRMFVSVCEKAFLPYLEQLKVSAHDDRNQQSNGQNRQTMATAVHEYLHHIAQYMEEQIQQHHPQFNISLFCEPLQKLKKASLSLLTEKNISYEKLVETYNPRLFYRRQIADFVNEYLIVTTEATVESTATKQPALSLPVETLEQMIAYITKQLDILYGMTVWQPRRRISYDPQPLSTCSSEGTLPVDQPNRNQAQHVANRKQQRMPEASPYYAFLVADGDKMGDHLRRLLKGKSLTVQEAIRKNQEFSAHLSAFSSKAKRIVEKHEGTLIYGGGDDIMAYLPLHTCLRAVQDLQVTFAESFAYIFKEEPLYPFTLSAGLVIVHMLEPLEEVRQRAHAAEKKAKDTRSTLVIEFHKRGGAKPHTLTLPWTESAVKNEYSDPSKQLYPTLPSVQQLIRLQQQRAAYPLSNGFAYDLQRLCEQYRQWVGASSTYLHPSLTEHPAQLEALLWLEVLRLLRKKTTDDDLLAVSFSSAAVLVHTQIFAQASSSNEAVAQARLKQLKQLFVLSHTPSSDASDDRKKMLHSLQQIAEQLILLIQMEGVGINHE
ncbi:type III-B CRISPR-associated protein Cas10/Cmr2 [Paenibacillus sp. WLX1005]|uniref:type III-B CRISPR-associated protein Cas10/Cmr2 n=1 Tax=Paenibacillus sp. WLX1005 TaxID=3243766 RepID=UPI003983F6FF